MESSTLTETELAAALRLSRKTLQRWRNAGTGPAFVKVAGRIRYPRAEVAEFVANKVYLPEAA